MQLRAITKSLEDWKSFSQNCVMVNEAVQDKIGNPKEDAAINMRFVRRSETMNNGTQTTSSWRRSSRTCWTTTRSKKSIKVLSNICTFQNIIIVILHTILKLTLKQRCTYFRNPCLIQNYSKVIFNICKHSSTFPIVN